MEVVEHQPFHFETPFVTPDTEPTGESSPFFEFPPGPEPELLVKESAGQYSTEPDVDQIYHSFVVW